MQPDIVYQLTTKDIESDYKPLKDAILEQLEQLKLSAKECRESDSTKYPPPHPLPGTLIIAPCGEPTTALLGYI